MRYFTIEQRETLRDALRAHAATFKEQIYDNFVVKPQGGSVPGVASREQALQLRRTQEALARLRSPQFGICSECEAEIPFRLLKLDPFATLCGPCQQRNHLAVFVPHEL
jgi:RNA polymerase-binding transcription factor DksA